MLCGENKMVLIMGNNIHLRFLFCALLLLKSVDRADSSDGVEITTFGNHARQNQVNTVHPSTVQPTSILNVPLTQQNQNLNVRAPNVLLRNQVHTQSDIETGGHNNTDDGLSVLARENDDVFATPALEQYTGCMFAYWSCLHIFLEDLELVFGGFSSILSGSAEYLPVAYRSSLVAYSIQSLMLASLFHKLYALSEKIVHLKSLKKLQLQKQNQINLKNEMDENMPILINGVDAALNTSVYATERSANCLSCCAVARNILLDQISICSIISHFSSGIFLTNSQIISPEKRSYCIMIATVLGILGSTLHAYVRILERKTRETENAAINHSAYVRYKKKQRSTIESVDEVA
jgi:hypothetical protein